MKITKIFYLKSLATLYPLLNQEAADEAGQL